MNSGSAGVLRRLDNLFLVEVGFGDGFAVKQDHFVGHLSEQTSSIVRGANRYRGMAGFTAGAQNTASDFAAICHQDLDFNPSSFVVFGFPVWGSLLKEGGQSFLTFI